MGRFYSWFLSIFLSFFFLGTASAQTNAELTQAHFTVKGDGAGFTLNAQPDSCKTTSLKVGYTQAMSTAAFDGAGNLAETFLDAPSIIPEGVEGFRKDDYSIIILSAEYDVVDHCTNELSHKVGNIAFLTEELDVPVSETALLEYLGSTFQEFLGEPWPDHGPASASLALCLGDETTESHLGLRRGSVSQALHAVDSCEGVEVSPISWGERPVTLRKCLLGTGEFVEASAQGGKIKVTLPLVETEAGGNLCIQDPNPDVLKLDLRLSPTQIEFSGSIHVLLKAVKLVLGFVGWSEPDQRLIREHAILPGNDELLEEVFGESEVDFLSEFANIAAGVQGGIVVKPYAKQAELSGSVKLNGVELLAGNPTAVLSDVSLGGVQVFGHIVTFPPPCNSNGTCDAGESCGNCGDCGACFNCGDGTCDGTLGEGPAVCPEDCPANCPDTYCDEVRGENYYSCNADCGSCGDTICNLNHPQNEDPSTCPQDCGSCGDGICRVDFENSDACAQDCFCGNGFCENFPNFEPNSCPQDCPMSCSNPNFCDHSAGDNLTNCSLCSIFCGDAICTPEGGENLATCNIDCGFCGDEICSPDEAKENFSSCPADCHCGDGACDPAQGESPGNCPGDCTFCGNDVCEVGVETVENCPADCGSCGDNECDQPFEGFTSCPADCGGGATCGDSTCQYWYDETYFTCPADCPDLCGDGICDSSYLRLDENIYNCPQDCTAGSCPNGVCDWYDGETSENCSADCLTVCGDGQCSSEKGETPLACPAECGICGNGACSPDEGRAFCPSDCYCGNGACESDEDPISCPADCPCGDGTCSPEKNEDLASCAVDCGTCGDGTCSPETGEDVGGCAQDCGTCGDALCSPEIGEDTATCVADCGTCGDGACSAEIGEDINTCPADCGGDPTCPLCEIPCVENLDCQALFEGSPPEFIASVVCGPGGFCDGPAICDPTSPLGSISCSGQADYCSTAFGAFPPPPDGPGYSECSADGCCQAPGGP